MKITFVFIACFMEIILSSCQTELPVPYNNPYSDAEMAAGIKWWIIHPTTAEVKKNAEVLQIEFKTQSNPEPIANNKVGAQKSKKESKAGDLFADAILDLPATTEYKAQRLQCLNYREKCLESEEGWGLCGGVFAACLVYGTPGPA